MSFTIISDSIFSMPWIKTYHTNLVTCPYHSCPSNDPFMGTKKPRLRAKKKVAPTVWNFQCKYCSLDFNQDIGMIDFNDRRSAYKQNPKLVGM